MCPLTHTAQGYLPRQLEVLDSKYGSETQLRSCIAVLKAAGVVAIADVVINHRCAAEQARLWCLPAAEARLGPLSSPRPAQDDQGHWNRFTGRYAWDASCVCSNSKPEFAGRGAAKVCAGFDCAPNIDHSQPRVRQVRLCSCAFQQLLCPAWPESKLGQGRTSSTGSAGCGTTSATAAFALTLQKATLPHGGSPNFAPPAAPMLHVPNGCLLLLQGEGVHCCHQATAGHR